MEAAVVTVEFQSTEDFAACTREKGGEPYRVTQSESGHAIAFFDLRFKNHSALAEAITAHRKQIIETMIDYPILLPVKLAAKTHRIPRYITEFTSATSSELHVSVYVAKS